MTENPIHSFVEVETSPDGSMDQVLTVLLRGAACPIGCEMCDLHHGLLPNATPIGSIPNQIRQALAKEEDASIDAIKLYNGGNFFDSNAVPAKDDSLIIDSVVGIPRIIVENHPRIGRSRTVAFARELADRSQKLEIAIGLESVRPGLLQRIGKGIHRGHVDGYVDWLHNHSIDVRLFIIHSCPYDRDPSESMRWTMLSIRHAISLGARHVSVIPARPVERWSLWKPSAHPSMTEQLQEIRARLVNETLANTIVIVDDPDWGSETKSESPQTLGSPL